MLLETISQRAKFDYSRAFSRNIGLVTEQEQERLKNTCVALPGLGGVGGAHLQTLARMGIGAFRLADPDTFDVVNFNRQVGATLSTVGRNKAEVMAEAALQINPDVDVRTFTDGITEANIGAFLDGVDVVVDGIEFYCMATRRMLFRAARERNIPVVTAGPIGFGAAVFVFMPGKTSFEEHFGIDDEMTRAEQLLAFALGLTPGMVRDVDPSRVDVAGEKGPALASACMICAATAATEVLKIVCHRGTLLCSPRGVYFDPFRGRTAFLRPRPSLRRSIRGRIMRWLAFRRFPEFRQMHDQEICTRTSGLRAAVPAGR
jgi:molybdopterin/thiamine biosynthesis adenylyltransferase